MTFGESSVPDLEPSSEADNMSRSQAGSIQNAFVDEVQVAFQPLVDELGLLGPELGGNVMQTVGYLDEEVCYRVGLDDEDMTISTRVEHSVRDGRLIGELGTVLQAAGLGSPNQSYGRARTWYELRKTLTRQADLIRRLHAFVNNGNVQELLIRADARKWPAKS
jgi:hypothetical protein